MPADVVVVIPARGGSQRIPGKNIKSFNGQPMISWPISASLATSSIARVVVSTDSPEIEEIANSWGAEIPFRRPQQLGNATAGTAPVIRHAIETLEIGSSQSVMCVYPTAAVDSRVLEDAIDRFRSIGDGDKFLISVGRHRSPLERALEPDHEGFFHLSSSEALHTRTQDLPQRYFDAGKFYLATARSWMTHETMMAKPFVPYLLPDWASVDIDEPEDWPIAEVLHGAFSVRSR